MAQQCSETEFQDFLLDFELKLWVLRLAMALAVNMLLERMCHSIMQCVHSYKLVTGCDVAPAEDSEGTNVCEYFV